MIIINKKAPSAVGGVEVVLRQMLYALPEQKKLVLTYREKKNQVEDVYENTRFILLDAFFPHRLYRWAYEYRRVLEELSGDHDTVFYHYPSFQPEFCLVPFKNKIVFYHTDVTNMGIVGRIYQRWITTRFLKDADKILVSSPNLIDSSPTLRKFKSRCQVLPLGVDEHHFYYRQDNYRSRLLLQGESTLLMFVGRMSRYKGFHVILDVLKDLDVSFRLVVVSKDPYRAKDAKFIKKHHLESRITKISDAGYKELPYYYSSADMLLMPSTDRAEAFGLVAVEAMACSVPVITTELGTGTSYHNIDGVTGRVISPGSSKDLYDAILDVMHSPPDKEAVHNRALDFSIETFNKRMRSVFS